MGKYYIGLLWA